MAVNSTHPCYDELSEAWCQARDVVAGERRMKEQGEAYVPKLSGQEPADYQAYLRRGHFFNGSQRTVTGLQGIIFAKPPVILGKTDKPKDGGTSTKKGNVIDELAQDADLQGQTLEGYSKKTTSEVLTVGRGGTLVDYSEIDGRAYFAFYKAESILNWQTSRVNGRTRLVMVALAEESQSHEEITAAATTDVGTKADGEAYSYDVTKRVRILKLVHDGSESYADENWAHQVELWVEGTAKNEKGETTEWKLESVLDPKRRGNVLNFIPFVFHNSRDILPEPERPPLDDLFTTNVAHWRQDVDYRHALHYTALPTPYAFGFDPKKELKIGSSTAWVSEKETAKVGYLEFTGSGLEEVRTAMDSLKQEMAILGARMIEEQQTQIEAAETKRMRQNGEASVLADISRTVSEGITLAMKIVYWWGSNDEYPELVPDEQASIALNRDFELSKLSPDDVLKLTQSWLAKGITKSTMVWNFKQGGVLAPNREVEEELQLLEVEGPPEPTGDPGEGE